MIAIKDDGYMRQMFIHCRDERGAHVHGDRLQIAGLSSAELVNPKIFEIFQGEYFISALQMFCVNFLDQIPTDLYDSGYLQHGNPMKQTDCILSKETRMPRLPLHKMQSGPSGGPQRSHSIRQTNKRRKLGLMFIATRRSILSLKPFFHSIAQLPKTGQFSMVEVTSTRKILYPFSYPVLMDLTPLNRKE